MILDQYHTGEQGEVFDGHVDQIDLGWDLDTCKAVSAACRFSLLMDALDPGEVGLLECAVAYLDYRCALAASRNRHPANEVR